jgi:hypothetical protein
MIKVGADLLAKISVGLTPLLETGHNNAKRILKQSFFAQNQKSLMNWTMKA